ncbi:hypothetical protein [Baaleninema simplex]|uniref:hypothetical protein n=1 Tax=Baaleninema simplex TaxID=2862350 RepID=UPI001181C49B|nr:hypothetical protein [Baaleninema simplex]
MMKSFGQGNQRVLQTLRAQQEAEQQGKGVQNGKTRDPSAAFQGSGRSLSLALMAKSDEPTEFRSAKLPDSISERDLLLQQLQSAAPAQMVASVSLQKETCEELDDLYENPVYSGRESGLGIERYIPQIQRVVRQYNRILQQGAPDRVPIPRPINWRWIAAMVMVESNPEATPEARQYDPMQVANEGDTALSVLRERGEQTHRFVPETLAVDLRDIQHTPFDEYGFPDYDESNFQDGQRINATLSIEAGVAWLVRKAMVTNNQGYIVGWVPWKEAIAAYNSRPGYLEKVECAFDTLAEWYS